MGTIKVGDLAPSFKGLNQKGVEISLSDYIGKKVILYFYPKDNTSGCTAESCNLNDNYEMWINKGFEVIGVSPDGVDSHKKFVDKYGFKFNLIADTSLEILNKYGVWAEKKMYGRSYMGVVRTTFVINEAGIIDQIFEKVKTNDHTNQILSTLE